MKKKQRKGNEGNEIKGVVDVGILDKKVDIVEDVTLQSKLFTSGQQQEGCKWLPPVVRGFNWAGLSCLGKQAWFSLGGSQ